MKVEIKRNSWGRFRKKFNTSNQYRQSVLSVKRKSREEIEISRDYPFMGIAIAKKGRLIDGVEFFVCQHDPNNLSRPVLSLKEPVVIAVEKDEHGNDTCLMVESRDGTIVNMSLTGESNPHQFRSLVEVVAYNLSEQRGFDPGHDTDNWCEAERRIRESEQQLAS
jgi:hypothetical protein